MGTNNHNSTSPVADTTNVIKPLPSKPQMSAQGETCKSKTSDHLENRLSKKSNPSQWLGLRSEIATTCIKQQPSNPQTSAPGDTAKPKTSERLDSTPKSATQGKTKNIIKRSTFKNRSWFKSPKPRQENSKPKNTKPNTLKLQTPADETPPKSWWLDPMRKKITTSVKLPTSTKEIVELPPVPIAPSVTSGYSTNGHPLVDTPMMYSTRDIVTSSMFKNRSWFKSPKPRQKNSKPKNTLKPQMPAEKPLKSRWLGPMSKKVATFPKEIVPQSDKNVATGRNKIDDTCVEFVPNFTSVIVAQSGNNIIKPRFIRPFCPNSAMIIQPPRMAVVLNNRIKSKFQCHKSFA